MCQEQLSPEQLEGMAEELRDVSVSPHRPGDSALAHGDNGQWDSCSRAALNATFPRAAAECLPPARTARHWEGALTSFLISLKPRN